MIKHALYITCVLAPSVDLDAAKCSQNAFTGVEVLAADHKHWAVVLQGHLKKFKEEIQELGNKILQAALNLHERVTSTFRKTAVNFHYEVRSLGFCGCLQLVPG